MLLRDSGGALNLSMSHHHSIRVTRKRKLNKIYIFFAQKIYFYGKRISSGKCLFFERYLYSCKILGTVKCASEMESNARIWSYEPIFTRIISQLLNSMVTSNCVNFNYFTQLFLEKIFTRIISCVNWSGLPSSESFNVLIGFFIWFQLFHSTVWSKKITRIISCVNWSELPSSESFNAFIGRSILAWDSSLWITWVMPSINCDSHTTIWTNATHIQVLANPQLNKQWILD